MKSILIISNDSRVESLVKAFQLLLKAQMVYVSDFDQGLKEVFDKRPSAVFIQSEISGISGDAVAKHIKGLLREDSPRLVLLREAPDKPLGSRNTFDENIDIFLPPADLDVQFKAQLEKIPSLQWRESVEPSAGQPPMPAEQPALVPPVEPMVVAPQPPPAPAVTPTQTRPTPLVSPAPQATAPKAATAPAEYPPNVPPQPQVRVAVSPPAATQNSGVVPPIAATDKESYSSFNGRGEAYPGSRRPWLYLAGFLITAAVVGTCYLAPQYWPGRKAQQPANAVPQTAKPASPAPALLKLSLPASIPLNNRDLSYEKGKPGWERYPGGDLEYLVFREQGAIKALQIIAHGAAGVPDGLAKSLLKESTGSGDYRVTSRQEKDGYLVEDGVVAGNVEILFYRKQPSGVIRAIVIAVS